jgi:hypothetical protein
MMRRDQFQSSYEYIQWQKYEMAFYHFQPSNHLPDDVLLVISDLGTKKITKLFFIIKGKLKREQLGKTIKGQRRIDWERHGVASFVFDKALLLVFHVKDSPFGHIRMYDVTSDTFINQIHTMLRPDYYFKN